MIQSVLDIWKGCALFCFFAGPEGGSRRASCQSFIELSQEYHIFCEVVWAPCVQTGKLSGARLCKSSCSLCMLKFFLDASVGTSNNPAEPRAHACNNAWFLCISGTCFDSRRVRGRQLEHSTFPQCGPDQHLLLVFFPELDGGIGYREVIQFLPSWRCSRKWALDLTRSTKSACDNNWVVEQAIRFFKSPFGFWLGSDDDLLEVLLLANSIQNSARYITSLDMKADSGCQKLNS